MSGLFAAGLILLAMAAAPMKPIHNPTRPQTTTQAGGTVNPARVDRSDR